MKHLTAKNFVERGYDKALERRDILAYVSHSGQQVLGIEASPKYFVLEMNDDNGEADPILAFMPHWYLRVELAKQAYDLIKDGRFVMKNGFYVHNKTTHSIVYCQEGKPKSMPSETAILYEEKAQVDRGFWLLREFT